MGFLKFLGGLAVVIVAIFVGFYAYMGGFSKVTVTTGSFGPAEIIYTTHKGAYENLGDSWTPFRDDYLAAGLEKCDGLGIYLDGPDTPKEDLRTIIGCRIDTLDEEQKSALRATFAQATLPASDALFSSFPFKNFASYFFAPTKVYPEMMVAAGENKVAPVLAIELYGVEGKSTQIDFIMPYGVGQSDYQVFYDAFE